jgi:hypothetical protein
MRKARTFRPGYGAWLALLAAASACSCSKGAADSDSAGAATAKLSAQVGDAGTITSVSGYGSCISPVCADIARACDDIIRTGPRAIFARRTWSAPSTPERAGTPGVPPRECAPQTRSVSIRNCASMGVVFPAGERHGRS